MYVLVSINIQDDSAQLQSPVAQLLLKLEF